MSLVDNRIGARSARWTGPPPSAPTTAASPPRPPPPHGIAAHTDRPYRRPQNAPGAHGSVRATVAYAASSALASATARYAAG